MVGRTVVGPQSNNIIGNTKLSPRKMVCIIFFLPVAEYGKVIIYEQPLTIDMKECPQEAGILECVTDEIAKLLATGKIDIVTTVKAVFIGDKRVLEDINLLAENGYGEDSFGNNIPLPDRLQYLRQ